MPRPSAPAGCSWWPTTLGEPDLSLAVIAWLADLVSGDHSEAGLPGAYLFARTVARPRDASGAFQRLLSVLRDYRRHPATGAPDDGRAAAAQEAMSEDWPLIEVALRHDPPLRTALSRCARSLLASATVDSS